MSSSNNGTAVFGTSFATSGNTIGVEGATVSLAGTGVYGLGGIGVYGTSSSCCQEGILGNSTGTSGSGVAGSNSAGGIGGEFFVGGGGSGQTEYGAYGFAQDASALAFGVYGGSVKGSSEFSSHPIPGAGVWGDTGQPGRILRNNGNRG